MSMAALLATAPLLLGSLLQLPPPAAGVAFLEVTSTGPAVLDSPVGFRAVLHQDDEGEEDGGPYIFKWVDDASPVHIHEEEVTGDTSSVNVTYPSSRYEPGDYRMTATVYVLVAGIYREELARERVAFTVTSHLPGAMLVNGRLPPNPDPDYEGDDDDPVTVVSAANGTVASVSLHDPLGFLDAARMSYYWFINDTNYGLTTVPNFTYHFANPGTSKIEVTALAHFTNSSSARLSQAQLLKLRARHAKPGGGDPLSKLGVFRSTVLSEVPLPDLAVEGKTFFKHGLLLDIVVRCGGSGPWRFCWQLVGDNYTVTGNETCPDGGEVIPAGADCSFPITWYFREVGDYGILAQVFNGVSASREVIHIHTFAPDLPKKASYLILPLAMGCAAVFIGVGACIFYKRCTRNQSIETADFDFTLEDDDAGLGGGGGYWGDGEEPPGFWQRLRDSMVNAWASTGDSISHVSSASSRGGQGGGGGHHHGQAHHHQAGGGAAANIHYGSIT